MLPSRQRLPRTGSQRRPGLWAGLIAGAVVGSVGCQAEYAGMTLPSGKYFYDDVQYFPPGPEFPYANTLAASQRARMANMGITPLGAEPIAPGMPIPPQGAPNPMNIIQGQPGNVNANPLPVAPEAMNPLGAEPAMPANEDEGALPPP